VSEKAETFASLRALTDGGTSAPTAGAIAEFLRAQPELVGRDVEVVLPDAQRGAGASSGTLFFALRVDDAEAGDFVLRYDLGGAFFRQYELAPQFHIMDRLHNIGFPAPKVRWLDEKGVIAAAPALVMDRVDGHAPSMKPYHEGLLFDRSFEQRRAMMFEVLGKFADLHAVDPELLPFLAERGKGDHFLDREIQWTHAELIFGFENEKPGREALRKDVLQTMEGVAQWLVDKAPRHRSPEIAHGDSTVSNVMFDQKDHVAAVLDWELCHFGLGEADLGYFLFAMDTNERIAGSPNTSVPAHDEIIDFYRQRRGKLEDWDYAQVMAAFRITTWTSIGFNRLPPELADVQDDLWSFQRDHILSAIARADG